MEAVNGVAAGPPPPSPLTGCYLLVVLGEPYTGSHKDIILQRLAKGLLSWNVNDCLVDLEKELTIVTEQGLEGEEARYGERLIQFASENLVTEILIHPSVSTLVQCVRNLLSSFTRHRHIIHAGYTFAANGSWILQDGTFSLADFSEAFQEIDVQRVIRAYENGISFDIHCSPEGEWMKLPKESFTRGCKLRVNPDDVLDSGSPAIANFVNYISPFLIPAELENILESSDVVGNIRFSRPTLYVFPGGQGDAALFGINGFNMLVDGGFSRKACFWDFVRHLDRLDAVMLTRLNNSNANGIGAVLRRKAQNAVYPQIGHFFCNIQNRKANLSPDGDKDKDPLVVNLLEEGQELISNLRSLELNPQLCYRDSEPINLYHKVGHGTLDMYVINPAKDSREVKEFLLRWNSNDHKLFANHKFSRECMLPLQNIVSICALLVWRPANPNDTITRILFPGSAPQNKIFEGLDRLKNLECIKHTVCTERTLAPPPKLKSKENILDRIVPPEKPKSEMKRNKPRQTPENKLIEDNLKNGLQNGHTEKTVKKSGSIESDKSESKPPKPKREENKLTESNKQEKEKIQKSKPDTNGVRMRQKPSEKKPSPPTPKKTVDTKKSELDKETTNQRVRSRISPSATPAKSTKDATNRRVLDKSRTAPKREVKEPKQTEKKEEPKKVERKPISRRPKTDMKLPQSPVKRAINGTHKPDSISRKGKLDRDVTTDSSTVSTPSVDQDTLLKKDLSKLTPEEVQQLKAQELAELKEEQEAIKELEAVFRKGDKVSEGSSDLRKVKDISIEDKTDTEEYLIVEKEIIEPSQPEESEADAKEEETVKLARDSEESEKKRDESEAKDDLDKDRQVDTEQEESGIGEQETDIEEAEEIHENEISKEPSIQSPEENKRIISKDEEMKEQALESQPDERVSANVESGATTTAPTLPEDERIPLNEIKEDAVDQIEEKHVKEETKEKETKEEIPVITFTTKTAENITKLPSVVGIRLDKETRIRDIVKTPDEVADLPVHEEVDVDHLTEFAHERVKSKDEIYGDSLVKDEELSPRKSEESQKEEEKMDAAEEKVPIVPQVVKKESEVEVTEEADKSNVKESQPLEKSPLQEEIDVHVETTIKQVEVVEKQDDTKEEDSIELKDDTREKELSVKKQPCDEKTPEEPIDNEDTPQAILQSSDPPKKDTIEKETIPKEDAVQKKEIIEEIVQKDLTEQPSIDQEMRSISKIKEVEEEKKESKDFDEKHDVSDVSVKDSKEEKKLETTIPQLPEVESKLQEADIVQKESEEPNEADEICIKETKAYEQKIHQEDEKESTGKISEIATPVEKKTIESAVAEKKQIVPEKDSPSPSKIQDESSERRESVDDVQKVKLSGEAQQEAKILPEKEMSLYSELKQEELKAEQDKEQEEKLADEPIEISLKKEKAEKSHEVDEKTSDLISNANAEEKEDKIQTIPEQSVKVESKEEEINTSGDLAIDKTVTGMKEEEESNKIPTEKVEQSSDASLIGQELLEQIEQQEEKGDQKISAEKTIDSSRNEEDQTLQTVSETKTHIPVRSELDIEGAKEERKMSITEKEHQQILEGEKEVHLAETLRKEEEKTGSETKTETLVHSELDKEEVKEERKKSTPEKEEQQKLEGKKEVDIGITAETMPKEEEKSPKPISETKTEPVVHSELDKEEAKEERKMSINEKEELKQKLEGEKEIDLGITAESVGKEEEKSLKTGSETKTETLVHSELDKAEGEEEPQKLEGKKEENIGIPAESLPKVEDKSPEPISETKTETLVHTELDKAEGEEERRKSVTEKEEPQKLEGKKEENIGIPAESLPKVEDKSPEPISETKTEPVDHSGLNKEEAKGERKMSIKEKEEHQQKLEGEKEVDLGKTAESLENEAEKSLKTVSATKTPEHPELDIENAKEERKMSIPEKEEHPAKLEDEKKKDLGITAESLREVEGKTTETVSETKTETPVHSELDMEKTKEERKMSIIGKEEDQQMLKDENEAKIGITAESSQHETQDTPQTDSVSKTDPSVHSDLSMEETKEERKMSVSAEEEHQQKQKDEKETELEKSSESKTVADSERMSDEKIESCETTQIGREGESIEIDKDLEKSRSPSPTKSSERKSSRVEQELKQQVPDSIESEKQEHKEKETKEVDDSTAIREEQDKKSLSPEKLPADHREELKETYSERDEGKDSAEKIEVSSDAEIQSVRKEDSETAAKEVASKDLVKTVTQTEEEESQQLKVEEQEKAQKDTVVRSPERRESTSDRGKVSEIIPTEEERKMSDDSKAVGIEAQPIIAQERKTPEQEAPIVKLKEGTDGTEEKTEDIKLQDDIETEKPKMISSEEDLHERKESIKETPEKIFEKIAPEKTEDKTTNLPTVETLTTTKVPESSRSPSSDDIIRKGSITQSGEQKPLSPTDKEKSPGVQIFPSEKDAVLSASTHESPDSSPVSKPSEDEGQVQAKEQEKLLLKDDKLKSHTISSEKLAVDTADVKKPPSSDEKEKSDSQKSEEMEKTDVKLLAEEEKSIKKEKIETTESSECDQKSQKTISKSPEDEIYERKKSTDKIQDLSGKTEEEGIDAKSSEKKPTVEEEKSGSEDDFEKDDTSDIKVSSSPVQQTTPIKPIESTADSHDRKSSTVSLKEELEISQTDMERGDKDEDDRKASIEKIESSESFLTRKFSVVHAEKDISIKAEKDEASTTSSTEIKEKSPDSISSGETSTTVTTEKETPQSATKSDRKLEEDQEDSAKDSNEQKIPDITSHKDIEQSDVKASAPSVDPDDVQTKEVTCTQLISKGDEKVQKDISSPKEISRTSSPLEPECKKVAEKSDDKTEISVEQVQAQTLVEEKIPSVEDVISDKKTTALETISSEKEHKLLDSQKETTGEEIGALDSSKQTVETEKPTAVESQKATSELEVKKEIEKTDEKADSPKDKPVSPVEKQTHDKAIERVDDMEQRDNKYASMSAEGGEEHKDINLNRELKSKNEVEDVIEKGEKKPVQLDESATKTPEDTEKIEIIEKQDHETAETEKGSITKKIEEQKLQKEIPLSDIKDFLEQEKLHSHKERGSLGEILTAEASKLDEKSEEKSEKCEDKSEKSSNITSLNQTIADKKEQREDDLKPTEIHQEKSIIDPKENQEQSSESRPSSIISDDRIMKTEKIKIDLTDKPEHAEPVLLKSTPESPIINIVPQLPVLPTDIDKAELGRKSPAEREEDVAKIVASVATVLKSDAPLEVFHKQIPLYTTELRETHITTCDSPVTEKDINIELLEEADWKDKETEFLKNLESSIIEVKKEQIEESSKTEELEDSGTVHRMLVTASSEDGGEETEICPPGTITFSRSSESSGRSSPENMSRKLSQTSSNLDTISDQTTVKELTDALTKKEPVIEEVCKSSKGVLEGARKSDKDHDTQQIYPDIDLKDEVKSLEDQIEEAIKTDKRKDESKDEKKEEKRSEIQEILSEALQDVSRDAEDVKETVAGKIGNVFGSIFSGASKVSEALSHTLSDSVKAVESSIDEGLKKVENEIDEVKHKIEDAESKVVDTLVEKKEMAEHIVADHLRESVSALSDTIDKTDKAKDSLVKQTEDTLDKMAAPLRETLGDALSNLAESLKHKEERSDTAQKEEKESHSKDKPTTSEDVETDEIKKWIETSGGEITQQIYPSLKDDLKNVTDKVEDTIGQISGGKKESPVDLEKPVKKVEESITSVISDATKEIEEALGKLQDTPDISSEEHEKKMDGTSEVTRGTVSASKEEKKEGLVKKIDQKISSTIEDLGEIVQETKKAVADHISDKEKSLKDEKERKLEELKDDISAKVEETKGDLIDKIEASKKTVEEKMSEMEESVTENSEHKLDEIKEKLESTLEKSEAAVESIEKDGNGLIQIISDTKEQIGDSATKAVAETDKEIEKMEKVANISTEDFKSLKDDISGIIHDSGLESLNESAKNIAQESKASHDTVKEDLHREPLKKESDPSVNNIIDDLKLSTEEVSSGISHLMEKKAQPTTIEEKDQKDETSESEHGKDSLLSRLETKAENMINSYTDEIKDTLKESSGTAEEDAKMSFESIKHDIDVKDMQKEMSELIDAESKTAQSVISEVSNIVKEEIDSSLKDLEGAEKTIAQEVAKKSSDISESLKSVVDTGHSLKEETQSTIKDLGSTIAEKSEELVEKSKGEIEKKISDVKTEVEGTKTAIIEKAESVSKDIKDTKDKVEETFSETKETVEASLCSIKQDLEKERDALVSAGKEIESEVKHAVEDVFDAGKKLFGGLFGSKKSKDEKKTKEVEKISTDAKVDKEESTQSCIQKDNRVTSELSGCISSDGSDEKCEGVVKDKCDVMGTLGLGKSGDISETCDISKGDVQTHLGLDVSQEKKLSISDVEIFVDEKGEDSSTNYDIKTAKKDESKVETVTKEGLDDKPHIKAEDSEFSYVSSHKSEIEKHITDVPIKEISSQDVQSVTSTVDAQKPPFGSERVSDSEDDFTSQLHHKMSEQMDPMMMSFYGALPDDDRDVDDGDDLSGRSEVPLTHLHDLTKAKFDGKKFSAATGVLEFPAQDPMTSSFYGELPSDKDDKDPIEAWGKPLGLPSPAPPNEKSTPKKERKLPSNVMAKNRINDDRARSESPSKNKKKINPVYVDLTYVPHHGNSNYAYVDFFKKVRARYYVFSGIEPSREVYNALLEAKQTWEDKDLEVTIIPTYDTDVLGYWVAENEELLTKYKIDLSPSASRCTINLQDHETSCSAYRLEF